MAGHKHPLKRHPPHRRKHREPSRSAGLRLLIAVAVFYCSVFVLWSGYRRWSHAIRLDTVKSSYYHYEFIELRLRIRDQALASRWRAVAPRALVRRNGIPVTTIAGLLEVPLAWDASRSAFIGRWPCPWNAPEGEYVPELVQGPDPVRSERLQVKPFRIERRKPKPVPQRLVVLTMESVMPLSTMKVRTPEGQERGWRGLLDWAQYIEADAFWILAGQTPGDKPGETWLSYNLPLMPLLAQETHRRGLKFGVWAMCYLTMSKNRLPRYQYALEIEDGKPVYTRAISLGDPQRPRDVAEFLGKLQAIPEVDYLGLDYIRNALGGYELVDDFIAEMAWSKLPPEWGRLSREERMVWFARKKIMRQDMRFIDAWQWWRARRVALIVKEIRDILGDSKSLWTFTLTWQRGWHHGQDSVMMNDAGADIDALMLYEATAPQYEWMMDDWHSYVRQRDVRLFVGDVVDWPLHQRSPRGPGEFSYRTLRAAKDVYQDGPAAGVFVHDLARALWGRVGPYTTLDWMNAARSAVRQYRSLKGPEAARVEGE